MGLSGAASFANLLITLGVVVLVMALFNSPMKTESEFGLASW